MTTLTLIRGLPSSGKSTLARILVASREPCFDCWVKYTHESWSSSGIIAMHAADDYFMIGVEYKFNHHDLPMAHRSCLEKTRKDLDRSHNVIVHNTFTQRWEMEPYLQLASEYNIICQVIDLFDGGCDNQELFLRSEHNVPLEAIERMRNRWEFNWRDGNPLPPWRRLK